MTETSEWKPLILIVEDDEELAQFNARLLRRQGYEVLVANTAEQARQCAAQNDPGLFVLDVRLLDGDGLTLCEEFRRTSDSPVLFLTGMSETTDKLAGLDAGGDYYLTKPYDKDEFIAVVRSLARRARLNMEKLTESSIIEKGPLTLVLDERKALVNGRDAELTVKEFAVLLMLVNSENTELTTETIYANVWGATMNKDANAIRLTISRLKKKLGAENADDFDIVTKYGGGYTFTRM